MNVEHEIESMKGGRRNSKWENEKTGVEEQGRKEREMKVGHEIGSMKCGRRRGEKKEQ